MKPNDDIKREIDLVKTIALAKKYWWAIGPVLKLAWKLAEPQLNKLFIKIKKRCQRKKDSSQKPLKKQVEK
jgi:hypothetical protein